jgi:tripartite-type tricarboxylate transporter receptor subunit TctC
MTHLRPHPEEPCVAWRLEGSMHDADSPPSFETAARRARPPQDEVRNFFEVGADWARKGLIALASLLIAVAPAVAQQSVADFYKGKTIRIIVGVGVGSGYDLNARVLARTLPSHIPGNPTVIVQNQPGAGSLSMTNALYNTGPFDGTVIGASFNGMPTAPLLEPSGARFDPNKLNWLGSTNRETQVTYVWHTAPVQKLADLYTTELIVGAQAPGSTQYDFPILLNHLFGTKFKVVTGYESTPKIHLAMESGEVQGNGATNWSTVKALNSSWLAEKKIRIIVQWGLKKNPELPDVPLVLDLAKTPSDRQALELALARLEFGRPFFLPPNVPPDRVEALRRAFDATVKDPGFLADADKSKIEVDPLTGEQVGALVEQVSHTPADTVARVRAAMENK